jgi:hypothetical protein
LALVSFKNRFPSFEHLLAVFSLTVFLSYSWSMYNFLYQLPSWSHYLAVSEIGVILAYMLSFNLLESLVIFISLVLLSLIIPWSWFRASFTAAGSIILLISTCAILLNHYINLSIPVYSLFILLIILVIFLAYRWSRLAEILEAFSERFTAFLYLLIPMSLISVIIVLIRNIL